MKAKIAAALVTFFLTLSAWGQMVSNTVDDGNTLLFPDSGQSFTATTTAQIVKISLRPGDVFNGSLLIYDGSVGSGTTSVIGTPVYQQAGVSLPASTTGGPMQDIVLTTPFPVIAGNAYTFILQGPNNFYAAFSDPYAGGQFVLAYGNTTTVPSADLAFQVWAVAPGDPASAVSIPTLSQWGLIVMSALLGLLSLARMRRRSKP